MQMIVAYIRPIVKDEVAERLRALDVPGASFSRLDNPVLHATSALGADSVPRELFLSRGTETSRSGIPRPLQFFTNRLIPA